MGLDMYAYKTRAEIADVDFDFPDDAARIYYWRKHPNLHGWMEELYSSKGGSAVFNCVPVKLTESDLLELQYAVFSETLPVIAEFFFCESRPEEKVADLAFIGEALSALRAGYNVFYSSWW